MFEACSSYPEHEGGELGQGESTSFFDYPECELNKIRGLEHIVELLVDVPMPTVVGTITQANRDTKMTYWKVTEDYFERASGKAAQNAAHSASVSSHQGPSLTTGSKENPVNTNTTNKPVRPEGFEPPTLGSEDRCSIQLSYGRAEHSVPTVVSICDGLALSFKTDSVWHCFGG